jgi:hypothetical protein
MFDENATGQRGISVEIKKKLSDLSTNSVLKMRGMQLQDVPEFWQKRKND